MARYFFHLRDDLDVRDEEGVELRGADAARSYAVINARDIMCGTLQREGRITLHHRIDVEDEQGALVITVPFSDAVSVESEG
jgi:hypothetical protein